MDYKWVYRNLNKYGNCFVSEKTYNAVKHNLKDCYVKISAESDKDNKYYVIERP